jgi:hypothetical protein
MVASSRHPPRPVPDRPGFRHDFAYEHGAECRSSRREREFLPGVAGETRGQGITEVIQEATLPYWILLLRLKEAPGSSRGVR